MASLKDLIFGKQLLLKFSFLSAVVLSSIIALIILSWVWLSGISNSIDWLIDNVQHKNSAAYEMEINAAETTTSVYEYVVSSHDKNLDVFLDNIDDFWRFHERYDALLNSDENRLFSEKVANEFRAIVLEGEKLIKLKNDLADKSEEVVELLHTLETIIQQLPKELKQVTANQMYLSSATKNLEELMRSADEFKYIDNNTSIENKMVALISNIEAITETGKNDTLSAASEKLLMAMTTISSYRHEIASRLQKLTGLLRKIDVTLDDEIQAEAIINRDYYDNLLHEKLTAAKSEIIGIGIIGAACIVAGLVFFFVFVIRPMNKLSTHIDTVKNGENIDSLNWQGDDEIAVLARAFDGVVTDQRNRTRFLEQAKTELEYLVSQRTQDIETLNRQLEGELTANKLLIEQLEKAKSAAESSSHAKTAFMAHMSHELRTPLNGITHALKWYIGTDGNDQSENVRPFGGRAI